MTRIFSMAVAATAIALTPACAQSQVDTADKEAIEKIVSGKLEKYYQNTCLEDQGFIKQNGDITVKQHVAAVGKELGDELEIRRFLRFQVGEDAEA